MADSTKKFPLSHTVKGSIRQRDPRVFVKPSVSSRKESAMASSNLKSKKGGQTQIKPVKATFGCPSEVDEQLKNKELIRAVKSILSSLTPETFHSSVGQLKKLWLNTVEELQEVVNLLFESAVMGDSAKLYARMCSSLPKVQFQPTVDSTTSVNFTILLARRCRAEYEDIFGKGNTDEKSERGLEQMKKELDDASLRRSIGTIQFIGELFLARILSEAAMHSCIEGLLKNQDEQSLECLCELLQIIGMNLETVTPEKVMNTHYDQIDVIAKDEKTSSRISLMLKTATDPKRKFLGLTGGRVPKTEDKASVSTPQEKEKFHLMPRPRKPTDYRPVACDSETFSEMVIVNFLTNGNLEEAMSCVAEQMSPSLLHVFVCSAVDLTFESSSDSRRKMGLLLRRLHEAGVLPAEQIVKGLQDIVETAVYIEAEVPNIWRCLAEVIDPVAHLGEVTDPVAHLGEVIDPVAHLGEVIDPVPHKGASPLMRCLEASRCSHLLNRLVC
ncbi:eukaryotic translation initiation factor 4 gamma 1-like isoform X2 [Paralichthys olivaceus]|uniref:eukaryotic translation initiation factor 4 gamma 1-like isoform X2 n=1 Tax=Paralichthys olivaceus TaxID=8255 RepID=UPI003752CC66